MMEEKINSILEKILEPLEESTTEHKGEEIILNRPFITDDKKKVFAVYALNSVGDVCMIRFMDRDNLHELDNQDYIDKTIENYKCDIQKDKSTPAYWQCRVIGADAFSFADKAISHSFEHKVFFDFQNKTVKSVRDGVQEYYGAELGLEPIGKVFTVYRSPETITAMVASMDSLPLIEDHIDPRLAPAIDTVTGNITDTEVIEFGEGFKDSTLTLQHKVAINDKGLDALSRGKRQLSLGYLGKLREHSQYDFEQHDLKPTHLAMVDNARGGDVLSFEDKQKQNQKDDEMDKPFIDEDGKLSLQKVAEMIGSLQEAIKNAPIEEVAKVMPSLEALIASSKANSGMESEEEEAPAEDMDKEEEKPAEDMDKEDETPVEDMDKDEDEDEKPKFTDSQEFKDALDAKASELCETKFKVVAKAKDFLEPTYNFADSSTSQIMKDAVEKELGESFEDSKIEGAFLALRKNESKYSGFGDNKSDIWETIKTTEI
jgi:hypothetical protein